MCAISFYQSWEAADSLNLLFCNHCSAIRQFGVRSAQLRFLNGVLWLYASLESVQCDKKSKKFGACIVTGSFFFSVMVSEAEGWRSTGAKDFG